MVYLVCESLKLGGVQSFYLRLAMNLNSPVTLVSLTELRDELLIQELKDNNIRYFSYKKLSMLSIDTNRATFCNSIPLSRKKIYSEFKSPKLYFHVSSLSGAVFVHRVAQILKENTDVRLNVGVYNGLIFGWKSKFDSYYSQLSSQILNGFFGEGGVLFTNEQSKISYEKKLGVSLSDNFMPVGIVQSSNVNTKTAIRNQPRLVSIGRLVKYKTYNMNVLKVMPALFTKGIKFDFDIYGDGELISELKSFVLENGLEKNVHFKGVIKYSEIPVVFDDADVFIGCGTTLVEAAANGVPSIIGIEDMSEPYTYGFLTDTSGFSYHEKGLDFELLALETVLEQFFLLNKTELQSLSQKHIERARTFSIQSSCKALMGNFELVDSYGVTNSALNVCRLQVSILFEQFLSIVGMNLSYIDRFKS